MNTRRIVALHRELAELDARRAEVQRAIADAYEEPEPVVKPKRKRTLRYVVPDMPTDELAARRADDALRKAGLIGSRER